MKDLDTIYKKIKEENIDYDERIKNGDIYVPHKVILDKRLTANEMLYLSTYYSLYKDIKKADKYSRLTKLQLYRAKKHLFELGYLKSKVKDAQMLKKETIKKSHQGEKCDWCKKECYILQEHHYPISSKNGGKKIVKICPNCHYTFHKLEGEKYE